MTKLEADVLGEPQLKTVLKYAEYINTIASAREATFREDNLQVPEEFWMELKMLSFCIINDVEKALNPDLGL